MRNVFPNTKISVQMFAEVWGTEFKFCEAGLTGNTFSMKRALTKFCAAELTRSTFSSETCVAEISCKSYQDNFLNDLIN